VTAIQDQYNPIFDAEYARLLVLKKKALVDANLTRSVISVLKDFLEFRSLRHEGLCGRGDGRVLEHLEYA
jgi:hypothetical protein